MSESEFSGNVSEVLGSLRSLAESINALEMVTIELLAILLVAQAMGGDPPDAPDATVSDITKTLTERLQRDRESTLDKVKHLLEAGTFTLEQLQAILST